MQDNNGEGSHEVTGAELTSEDCVLIVGVFVVQERLYSTAVWV